MAAKLSGKHRRARRRKREYFDGLLSTLYCSRAAVKREQHALALRLLIVAARDLGEVHARYGMSAKVGWLHRSICGIERTLAERFFHAFTTEPVDACTRIALALYRAGLGERKPPQRAPLRLLSAKAEVAS